jgi:hypothetical protein
LWRVEKSNQACDYRHNVFPPVPVAAFGASSWLIHWELGYAYRFAGMLNESLAECERARQLDPQVNANGSVLNTYLYLGQYRKFLDRGTWKGCTRRFLVAPGAQRPGNAFIGIG